MAATRIATVADTSGPGRAALSGRETGAAVRETGGATTYSKPAFVIRSVTFCASSVDGSTFGCLQRIERRQSGIRGHVAGHRVLERRALLEYLLSGLTGDELDELLRLVLSSCWT